MALRHRLHRGASLLLVGTIAAFVASTTRYYMWWGGWSVPARFLVPVLPLTAPFVAIAWDRLRAPALRGVAGLLLVAGLVITTLLVAEPDANLMFNDRDGSGKLVEWLGGPTLQASLPSFLWEDWRAQWPGLVAVFGTLGIAAAAAGVASRRGGTTTAGVCAAMTAAVVGGAVIVRAVQPRDRYLIVVQAARMALVNVLDEARPGLINLTTGRTLDVGAVLPRLVLRPAVRVDGTERPVTALGPLWLPPGTYEASVWLRPGTARDRSVVVSWHPGRAVLAREPAGARLVALSFQLPREVEGPPVWVGADSIETAQAIERVDIVPLALVPRSLRTGVQAISMDALSDWPGAALAYLDHESFAEGGVFWTRGAASAKLLIVPAGARRVRVGLQSGPVGAEVRVVLDGVEHHVSLPPQTVREIEPIELTVGRTVVPLQVRVDSGFRPSEHDAKSADNRWLGCRVYVALE